MSDDHNEFFHDGLITPPMVDATYPDQFYRRTLRNSPYSVATDAINYLKTTPTLENLRKLTMIETAATNALTTCVHNLRINGTTWEAIGMTFGITKQAAQQRFRFDQ